MAELKLIEALEELDKKLIIHLNQLNHPFLDPIMYWFSDKYIWFPFYAVLIGFLIYKFRLQGFYMVLALGLTVAICDQVTSSLMKPFFERLRPCHDPVVKQYLNMISNCGGMYGFASSHASNAFGFAVFSIQILRSNFKWIWWLLPWALLVSYSRVYLGVHYPGDVIVGALVGTVTALSTSYLFHRLTQKQPDQKNNA